MLPTNRKQAKLENSKYYFTGNPCKNNHISKRQTTNGVCYECFRTLIVKKYSSSNLDKISNKNKKWYEENKEYKLEYNKKRIERNRDKILKQYKDYHEKHKEERNSYTREHRRLKREYYSDYMKKWSKDNPGYYSAKAKEREEKERKACPAWLSDTDKQVMIDIYKESKALSKSTGIKRHVDHICPLKSDIVCGLHVPWNLQILTQRENNQKYNKWNPLRSEN